jgi:predicted transcriptional regulator of viral defense system
MAGQDWAAKLYPVAESQAGYFTRQQAAEVGVDSARLARQVAAGRLMRVAPGVYRLVQFPSSPHEDMMIAWLQTGPGSVISHDSALALYDLSDALPNEAHVTVPRTASRRRSGMRLHTQRLMPREVTRRSGMAVTTPPRTIADMAFAGLAEELIAQAVQQALVRGLALAEEIVAAGRTRRVREMLRRAVEEAENQ